MKKVTTIMLAAAASVAFALPAVAAESGIYRTYPAVQPTPETIADLEQASARAQKDALTGNKDNLVFRRKSYDIDQLIARLRSGQAVSSQELDHALAPARVW